MGTNRRLSNPLFRTHCLLRLLRMWRSKKSGPSNHRWQFAGFLPRLARRTEREKPPCCILYFAGTRRFRISTMFLLGLYERCRATGTNSSILGKFAFGLSPCRSKIKSHERDCDRYSSAHGKFPFAEKSLGRCMRIANGGAYGKGHGAFG